MHTKSVKPHMSTEQKVLQQLICQQLYKYVTCISMSKIKRVKPDLRLCTFENSQLKITTIGKRTTENEICRASAHKLLAASAHNLLAAALSCASWCTGLWVYWPVGVFANTGDSDRHQREHQGLRTALPQLLFASSLRCESQAQSIQRRLP